MDQDQPVEHRDISFGDTVRVKATPETEAAGLAGLTGEVSGQSVPSISGASPIVGPLTKDYAVNVFFADRNEAHWFAEQVLEFVDHTPGAALRLDGVAGQWVRDAEGNWELKGDVPDRPEARPGLLGRLLKRITGASVALLLAGAVAHARERPAQERPAQEGTPSSIVDGVVSAVCQKQIVLLGELPTHGEAHGFDAKSKIADRLMSQCGFTAILFEAPIYDFIGFERAVDTRTAAPEQLDNAIGRFWWTRELTPWRRALFDAATRQQQRVMAGGLDDQISITAHYARTTLPRLIAAASSESTAAECGQAVTRHVGWTYDRKNPFDERAQLQLQQCARNAANAAEANRSLDAADRVMLESFARYADRQRTRQPWDREESMYRNLVWYLERLPADSRVVIWTATVHAARQHGSRPVAPLGARAVARWGDRVGAVGFTAYAGYMSQAGRPASPIAEAPPDSLEAAATKDSAWALLDSEKLRAIGRVSSRLFGKFATETWSDYFDAVVVIRQEAAPTFDPWK